MFPASETVVIVASMSEINDSEGESHQVMLDRYHRAAGAAKDMLDEARRLVPAAAGK